MFSLTVANIKEGYLYVQTDLGKFIYTPALLMAI
jgi:hypothetical protein